MVVSGHVATFGLIVGQSLEDSKAVYTFLDS